jgi:hypothetical protein
VGKSRLGAENDNNFAVQRWGWHLQCSLVRFADATPDSDDVRSAVSPVDAAAWRLAIVLSIPAFAAYNIAAERSLLANGLTASYSQRIYCAPSCVARYQPRVITPVVI